MHYIIFTDGACKGNPGPGGWGSITASKDKVFELGGREQNTTNNRMELKSAIEALAVVLPVQGDTVTVYADSSYVINGITKWAYGWQKNGWRTAAKQPVLNDDLWKRLVGLVQAIDAKIVWTYVGGHVGVAGNERVDTIASDFAEGKVPSLYNGSRDSYLIDIKNLDANAVLVKTKAASRTGSKAKAHSYVSEVDGVIKTHKTWHECEACVSGKKARFKKATSAAEEQEIIRQFS